MTPSSSLDQDGDPSDTTDNSVATKPNGPMTPYKPSPAETLAVHIHAFVSSASSLSTALSSPLGDDDKHGLDDENGNSPNKDGNSAGSNPFEDAGLPEREEDDELKLLRLRTKIHEIIIIPDRKFLLCVVHDVSAAASGAGGRASAHSRQ
ncbi:uncharacterized protein GIQ15_05281 [Arthroderma uncinatum]|uniref:uncharacterized protein n=1 Tax=Arthroderma uncinatum TaxID=74035 RepID=UPI00144AE4C7|nr:uncharacterized protein GIQ15_05281 [Arthroderma uncinatum]KAF3482522.1 hypothetical protein GIQ15_05281 [Arthroderma uncinatum]